MYTPTSYLSIHLLVAFGLFPLLAVVNNTAVNVMHEYLSLCFQVAVLWIIYLQVELLGQMVIACLVFEEPPNCFPQYLHHFTFPPEMWGIQFLHILADTCYFPLKKSYPSKCEVAQIYIFKGAQETVWEWWTDGGKSIRQRKTVERRLLGNGFSGALGPRE